MEFFKCNLYIIGSSGVGKTFLRNALDEFFYNDRKSVINMFKGSDWTINTENVQIEVEIKEIRNFDFPFPRFDSKEFKSIYIYISQDHKHNLGFSIHPKDIEQLKILSKEATIIVSSVFRYDDPEKKVNLNQMKKLLPFIEYIIPIDEFYYREFERLSQISYLLRQIIINSHPHSLAHAKKLIKDNFESENPTLDLGNCGLTSLNDVKELFKNTHLKKLILSNEWGEYQDDRWIRRVSNNKLEPNIFFKFPKEIANLHNLESLIAGGNWKNHKRRGRYFFQLGT